MGAGEGVLVLLFVAVVLVAFILWAFSSSPEVLLRSAAGEWIICFLSFFLYLVQKLRIYLI